MYKKLDPQDIVVAGQPLIEPAGSASNGACVAGVEYTLNSINSSTPLAQQQKYKQFANIIQGDSPATLPIGSAGFSVTFNRNNFKESLHPNTFSINGVTFKTGSNEIGFTEAGRQYISTDSNHFLYPDIGVLLSRTSPTNIVANSEIIATNSQVFIRVGASEFNYTTNPSFLDKDDNVRSLDFIYNPKTYITTVGLYNDNGDLLAVAKVPKPIEKSFEKEVLITIELNY